MTLRLTVQQSAWKHHVDAVASATADLIPVVKGNGYGFGRAVLHPIASALSPWVCVGTIHELDHIVAGVTPVVLTPTATPPPGPAILTIGSVADVRALDGWQGDVIVKLLSSMRRYGAAPDEVDAVVVAARSAGLTVVGTALHLPLAGSDTDRVNEVEQWIGTLDTIDTIDPETPLWLSHLAPETYAKLRLRHPQRDFKLRLGTALWHGDKSMLQLTANVLMTRQIAAGETAGYRLTPSPVTASLLLIGCGSAHGVAALADGRSPFHFAGRRLTLLEAPHMHTSMALVADGQRCPAAGDRVDVQRPLITANIDEIEWT